VLIELLKKEMPCYYLLALYKLSGMLQDVLKFFLEDCQTSLIFLAIQALMGIKELLFDGCTASRMISQQRQFFLPLFNNTYINL